MRPKYDRGPKHVPPPEEDPPEPARATCYGPLHHATGRTLPIDQFGLDGARVNGRREYCLECEAAAKTRFFLCPRCEKSKPESEFVVSPLLGRKKWCIACEATKFVPKEVSLGTVIESLKTTPAPKVQPEQVFAVRLANMDLTLADLAAIMGQGRSRVRTLRNQLRRLRKADKAGDSA